MSTSTPPADLTTMTGGMLEETWSPPPGTPGSDDSLPMMQPDAGSQTGGSPTELMARKVVVDAAREALVLLVSGLDGDGASRALLQIERVSKCFRAATAHLGQPVYPEELGQKRRGGGMLGLPMAYGGGFQDRETMGVQAFQQLMSFAGQQTVAQIPRQIDALLSAAETARRGGMTDLADTLEKKARAMTASLDTEPAKQAAHVAAATADIARMADAAEGGLGGFGNNDEEDPEEGNPFFASGGLDELADAGFPQTAATISELTEDGDDDLFSDGPRVSMGSIVGA